ncbi:MAG: LysR family transcriptional regulator [Moritella sp.]|uniref:LysR family transcriptional regulator n=1 Tax=Moritella sp. TaxID=78556 RepID=UPI001DC6CD9F|nr:LysR family transcriptional regulator [Moritella sp.]NQZ51286.1 LysR family transcriptional regulator [Moritella sp.]
MKIQLDYLTSFISAAEKGSFSAAAKELKKSQASVSIAIQNLEIDFGFELFNRNKKYPVLTEKGKKLLKSTKLMMLQYNDFISQSRAIEAISDVKIRIGIDPLVCSEKIIKIICEFSELYPLVDLFIMQQNSKMLYNEVIENKLDLAIGVFSDLDMLNCEFVGAFHMRSSWVASPDYKNGDISNVSIANMANSRLLTPMDLKCPVMSELSVAGQVWYVEDIHTILSFCRDGVGICNLPNFVTKHDLNEGRLSKVSFAFNKLTDEQWVTSIIWPKNESLSQKLNWIYKKITDIEFI